MRKLAPCIVICYFLFAHSILRSSLAQIQEPFEDRGAAVAWCALQRLRSTATVLQTTAHQFEKTIALKGKVNRDEERKEKRRVSLGSEK